MTPDTRFEVVDRQAALRRVTSSFSPRTVLPVADAILGRVNAIDPAPGLIVFDYLRRLRMPVEIGRRPDPRELVSDLMNECRNLATQGAGVLVLSAANRAKSGYQRLTITSGRESSEVEYAAESVWATQTGTDGPGGRRGCWRCSKPATAN